MESARSTYLSGIRDVLPLLLGVLPFGIVAGVAAIGIGMSKTLAIMTSAIAFAGASQLAAIDLMEKGAPIVIVIATALVVNLRMAMYSASIAPHFAPLSGRWKGFLSYFLTDQGFAVSLTRYDRGIEENNKKWYYLGTATGLMGIWMLGTVIGVTLGSVVPVSWSLDFAVPLTFIALLAPAIKDRATMVSALSAGIVAPVAIALPMQTGIIAASITGVVAGYLFESRAGS